MIALVTISDLALIRQINLAVMDNSHGCFNFPYEVVLGIRFDMSFVSELGFAFLLRPLTIPASSCLGYRSSGGRRSWRILDPTL